MTRPADAPTRQRRRGPQLEAALLDAAWDELVEVGYARLTMESVASRGRTGVAVLYRRWANKDELVIAALEHYRDTHPVEVPDTGNLRDDLIAELTAVSEARAGFFAIAAATFFSGLLAGTGLDTPARARDRLMADAPPARVRTVFQRAHDRGEIDLAAIPASVLRMPYDLVRQDLLMDLKPLPPKRIREIVDELFLPLARRHQEAGSPRRQRPSTRSR